MPALKQFLAIIALATGSLVIPYGMSTVYAEAPQSAPTLKMKIDQAVPLKLNTAASAIVVGNAMIANVALVDETSFFLTGKSKGETNIIALDKSGMPIFEARILVNDIDTLGRVKVYRGADKQTLACTPTCQPVLSVGDAPTVFNNTLTQLTGKETLSTGGTSR